MKIKHTLIAGLLMGLLNLSFAAAPETLTQSVTYNGETITLDMVKHSVRGPNYEVLIQDATGAYNPYTAPEVRTYIGRALEHPESWAAGVLLPDGTFRAVCYFDRGAQWKIENSTVYDVEGTPSDDFESWPSRAITPPGFAGIDTYRFDIAIDYAYEVYSTDGQSDTEYSLHMIDYSVLQIKTYYLMDALVHADVARVVIRGSQDDCPYWLVEGVTQLGSAKTAWEADHADADRDVVCVVADIGGGVAWLGTIAGSSGYSVNQSGSNAAFDKVFRHELGHNWSVYDFHANNCEGKTINCGNQFGRFSGAETYSVMKQRNNKLGFMENMGVYTDIPLPPYASLDLIPEIYMGQSAVIDVLGNDHDVNGDAVFLLDFDAETLLGGSVALSAGTGPGGRDELIYTAPANTYGFDSFKYRVQDSTGKWQTGKVYAEVRAYPVSSVDTDADTYVRDSSNHGGEDTIIVKKVSDDPFSTYNRTGWIHFDTSELPLTHNIQLKLAVDATSFGGVSGDLLVWGIKDGRPGDTLGTDWTELGITVNNAPQTIPFAEDVDTTLIGTIHVEGPGEMIYLQTDKLQNFLEADTNGEVTFLLTYKWSGDLFRLSSRENPSSGAAKLETLPDKPLPNIDAYVRGGASGDLNYGSTVTLDVKNHGVDHSYTRESYLRFTITTDPATSATLTLTPADLQAGGDTTVFTVRLLDDADDDWAEDTITYNNRPLGTGSAVTFTQGQLQVGVPFEIDVTSLINQAMNTNGLASFQIVNSAEYHVTFNSREDLVDVPKLELTTADTDGDGIPDSWEIAHGLDPLLDDASEHSDSDAYNNWFEYVSDTDPQDGNVFQTFQVVPGTGTPTIRFSTSANRLYTVRYRTNLIDGVWQDLDPKFFGTGSETNISDSTGDSQRFYRIRIELP